MKAKWKPPIISECKLTKWNWMVQYKKNLKIGNNVDIGAFTYINARYIVIIDDDVQIGGGCHIYSDNIIDGTFGRVHLMKGCKIGAHSVILPGVTVGKDAVVGAFSLVKEDIPPGEVWAGVPIRKIDVLPSLK